MRISDSFCVRQAVSPRAAEWNRSGREVQSLEEDLNGSKKEKIVKLDAQCHEAVRDARPMAAWNDKGGCCLGGIF